MCQRVSKHTALTSKYSLFSRCTAKPGCLFGCAKTAKDMSSHPMLKCPIYTAFNVSFCHRSHSFAGFCVAFMQKTDCLKMPWRENAPIHVLSSAHMHAWHARMAFIVNYAACTQTLAKASRKQISAKNSLGRTPADLLDDVVCTRAGRVSIHACVSMSVFYSNA